MSVQGMMFNPYMNYYNSYAAMGDTCGFDNYYNDSLYMSYPMAYNYGGYYNNYNYQQYYTNMAQMQDFNSQYIIRNAQLQRQNDIGVNSPDYGINTALKVLQTKIASNEQEQIQGALLAFKEAVRAKYPQCSEDVINSMVSEEYTRRTGTGLIDDIQQYGSTSFWQGFKQTLGLGIFADNKTAAENIAEITGQPVSRSDNMAKIAGNTCGGAAAGAAAGFVIGAVGGPIGMVGGAIIGGVCGLIKGIFG